MRAALASLPVPPLPEAIASRLDTALAAAATERSASASGTLPAAAERGPEGLRRARQPGRRGRHGAGRERGRSWSPSLVRGLAAAGVVAVLAGGGVVIARLATGTAATRAASPAVGSAASASGAVSRGSALVPGSASGTQPLPTPTGQAASAVATVPYRLGGSRATAVVIASGSDLSAPGLAAAVRRAVGQAVAAGPVRRSASATGSQSSAGVLAGVDLARLSGCVTNVAAGSRVLVVEVARYQGRPAILIVSQASASASGWRVTIVEPGCSAANADVISRGAMPASG